jgi:hypothetical protein
MLDTRGPFHYSKRQAPHGKSHANEIFYKHLARKIPLLNWMLYDDGVEVYSLLSNTQCENTPKSLVTQPKPNQPT